jgi:hypothetical protein
MRNTAVFVLLCTMSAGAANAQQRELEAHVHGESELTIAVEGNALAMELKAPGMDIVGFEHEPSTDEQKAAVEKAREALSDPLRLFVMSSAAGCAVTEAHVNHQFGEGHEEEEHSEGETGAQHEEHEEETHSQFHAEYQLTCEDPSAVTAIEFRFFEQFPSAEAVEVQIVSAKGQFSFEVERGNPRLDLAAAI